MKKINLLFGLIFVLFLLTACEEDFNPKIEIQENYMLTFLINMNNSFHTAAVTRVFDVEGYDPSSYTEDISVAGADIRIWYKDTVYVLKDSTLNDSEVEEGGYKHFYYLDNFNPDHNELIEVEAVMPNGRKLVSRTTTPFTKPNNYLFGRGDNFIPPSYGGELVEELIVYWEITVDPGNALFIPRLFITYTKNELESENKYLKEIPIDYSHRGDSYVPVYPPGTTEIQMRFKADAIDRAMSEISEGDPNKQNYTINNVFIYFTVLDENLSAYFGALQMISDGFTVRVDAPDFTNVEGGSGVFGTYFEKFYNITIGSYYVNSFGYNYNHIPLN